MLKGKVALITGASRGIGQAIAEKFAKQGASVIINYNCNEEAAKEVLSMVNRVSAGNMIYKADVRDFEAVQKMVNDVIAKYGRIDILVNNAGIARNVLLKDMSIEDWHDVVDTSLTGVFHTCKLVSPHMIEQQSGKIVNMSSIGGMIAIEGIANYSSAKAGVMALTRILGKELIPHGINVNCIAPGLVNTDLLMKDVDDVVLEMLKSQVPAKRICEPEEVADLALYLCTEGSKYMVGQAIVLDGGLSL